MLRGKARNRFEKLRISYLLAIKLNTSEFIQKRIKITLIKYIKNNSKIYQKQRTQKCFFQKFIDGARGTISRYLIEENI